MRAGSPSIRLAATAVQRLPLDRSRPQLLGGKLAIRGTRLAVSLILESLAGGMSLADIDQSFNNAFPHEALPEVLKVASELADPFHVAA